MIAGPNGAGKTTLAHELISSSPFLYEFINADEIARGLAPNHPETVALMASKLMISRLKELLEAGKNFAFETTLSGTNYVKHLSSAKAKGYDIILFFLWLNSPEQALQRVAQRVKQGGHFVPQDVIFRRYYAGIKNLLTTYLPLADMTVVLNNSTETTGHKMIARVGRSKIVDVLDQAIWSRMNEVAYER
jgi:predicted ABC-type ATPase